MPSRCALHKLKACSAAAMGLRNREKQGAPAE